MRLLNKPKSLTTRSRHSKANSLMRKLLLLPGEVCHGSSLKLEVIFGKNRLNSNVELSMTEVSRGHSSQ